MDSVRWLATTEDIATTKEQLFAHRYIMQLTFLPQLWSGHLTPYTKQLRL